MRRHLRHRILKEIGDPGVARLLAHRAAPPSGHPEAAAVAADYLARAGVTLDEAGPRREGPSAEAVTRLAGRPELEVAAAMLAGAFEAVETLKAVLEVGRPGSLEGVRLAPAQRLGQPLAQPLGQDPPASEAP